MPALEEFELTEAEKLAKEQFKLFYKEAYHIPCNIDNCDVLPPWYDEEKYKRGQKYFIENRAAILNSNLIGIICFLAEPKAFHILARDRTHYITTILYTLKWYEIDLTPGSESRKSLAKVRKLHYAASNFPGGKKIGHITQGELSFTQFGFMGLALTRAEIFGIKSDNKEDREAYVHLWAVLCYMIGIKDEYNICLLPLDALIIVCQMFMRYVVIPIIQIELPEFKEMTKLMFDELDEFLPHMDYESQIFRTKLILGLPGYQYKVDHSETLLCRSILNQNDIDEMKNYSYDTKAIDYNRLSVDIPIIEKYEINKGEIIDANKNLEIINYEMNEFGKMIHSLAQLTNKEYVKIYCVDYEQEWCKSLSDEKYYQLSDKGQKIVNFKKYEKLFLDYKTTKYIIDTVVNLMISYMKQQSYKTHSKHINTESLKENALIKSQFIIRRILIPFIQVVINCCEYFRRT